VTWNAKARRRCFGAVCLALAIGLLIGGEAGIEGHPGGLGFIAYWLLCLMFTSLAICAAFLDARALRRQSREEQRALLEDTLREIEREQKPRESKGGPSRAR
jgi:membrane protein implicated in regulation of membrane protease activity